MARFVELQMNIGNTSKIVLVNLDHFISITEESPGVLRFMPVSGHHSIGFGWPTVCKGWLLKDTLRWLAPQSTVR